MPPPRLIDLSEVDLDRVVMTRKQIYEQLLPHRYEFELLDGVCLVDHDAKHIVTVVDIKPDDWWVRGHVEGRPLLPGVLMLEMAGQPSVVGAKLIGRQGGFIGFGGIEACRFREAVTPPARLHILCVGTQYHRRRVVSRTQGVVGGRMVFEATIIGLKMD